ncbi:hypothetical protein VPH35_123473 [Triticum aestivum]
MGSSSSFGDRRREAAGDWRRSSRDRAQAEQHQGRGKSSSSMGMVAWGTRHLVWSSVRAWGGGAVVMRWLWWLDGWAVCAGGGVEMDWCWWMLVMERWRSATPAWPRWRPVVEKVG